MYIGGGVLALILIIIILILISEMRDAWALPDSASKLTGLDGLAGSTNGGGAGFR